MYYRSGGLHTSKGRQLVKYGHGSCGARNEEITVLAAGASSNLLHCVSLLGNDSVSTFPRKRRIVGGFVFYAIHVVSKKSRRIVLLRTSCFTLDLEGGVVTYITALSQYSHECLRKLTVKQLTFYPLHMVTSPEHRQAAKRCSRAGVVTPVQLN
jgi:hypothetical protein